MYQSRGVYMNAKVSNLCTFVMLIRVLRLKVQTLPNLELKLEFWYLPTNVGSVFFKTNSISMDELQVVFCIHNIAYQGRFAFEDYSLLNLPNSFKSSFDFMDG